jgi:lipopolysaccharide/colanic/teichoic acid biosynthesis glycosyltransferase
LFLRQASNVSPSDAARETRGGSAVLFGRRRRRDIEIGQLLLRNGDITPEQLRLALRIQAEQGGHVGAILKRIGACDARAISEALRRQAGAARARGKQHSIATRARGNPSIGWLQVECRPQLVTFVLCLADAITLGLAAGIVWLLVGGHQLVDSQAFGIVGLVPLCMAVLAASGLYLVTPLSPPNEIRASVQGITFGYLGCWLLAALTRTGAFTNVPHHAWVAGWLVSVVLVPSVRGTLRSVLSKRSWWGRPVVVLGAGRVGRAVVTTMQARPQLGLKPVAILDDDPTKHGTVRAIWGEADIVIEALPGEDPEEVGTPSERSVLEQFSEVEGVPVLGGLDLAPAISQRLGISTAVLAMPEMDAAKTLAVIERFADSYTNVLVIPDLFNLAHFGAPTRYLGGALGIEVQRQLLRRGPRIAKRAMDVAITTVSLPLIFPILLLLALVVKLDSKGSVFYPQKRLGQDGVRFGALKFRTMYVDAEQRLKGLLASDAALRSEYEQFHKLKNDPRVTRVGRFLRKYSLDELPQLLNVLVGQMSLVGPRPYLEREIPDMDGKEAVILRVKPGITGIWQVTWRNESTFEQRLQIDVEYVRNWSPWLDIYVLARTVPVVLGGTGS